MRRRFKVDVGAWWTEEPRRAPAAYACELAATRVLPRDDWLFLTSSPDIDEIAEELLHVETELAHALVLALDSLPASERPRFAAAFYAGRRRRPRRRSLETAERLRVAGTAAHHVLALASPALARERIRDLLVGAAQGDDLAHTPEPALEELRQAIASARQEIADADPFDRETAATLSVLEVLDPASGDVGLQEVLVRSTWAALRSWPSDRVLGLLRGADDALRESAPA